MKDEIKEILELIGNAYYYGKISEEKKNSYCKYITNLQEENKRLKEDIRKDEVYFKTFELAEECDQKQDIIDDYKSRIDKATKILNKGLKELNTRSRSEVYIEEYLENALDELQGSDKE